MKFGFDLGMMPETVVATALRCWLRRSRPDELEWGYGKMVVRRIGLVVLEVVLLLGAAPAWARFEPVTCKNNAFSPQQEVAEGAKAAAEVYQEMPVLPDSDPVARYVQQLGAKLVAHAPVLPGVGQQWPFNFHVVASADINAFALPGGAVFVNMGTIQAADTEAQLAGVMAHEISHVVMRHSTCNITKQQSPKLGFGIASVLSSVLLGDSALGTLAQGALGLGAKATFLKMSREDEQQADLLGAGIAYDSGYDPRGMVQFFETIEAKYGAGGAQWLSDHPNPGNRTEYVNAEIATFPRRTNAVVTTPAFQRMHAVAMGEKAYSAKDVTAGVWKRAGYATGPGASATTVSAPMAAGQGGGAGATAGTGAGTETAVRLSASALGVGARMVHLQAARFAVDYPANWVKQEDSGGTVLLVPQGGSGGAGLVYGAVIGVAKQSGDGVYDQTSLDTATAALAQKLSDQNGGLQRLGSVGGMQVGGKMADGLELQGKSPLMENGTAVAERDWLVTVARPDGDVNYIVFVSPERDFAVVKPVFVAMLQSFQAQ